MEILFVIGILAWIISLSSSKEKNQTNCCPDCGKPTLKINRTLFGREYLACSRWFCGWDERGNPYQERKEAARRQRAAEIEFENAYREGDQQRRIWAAAMRDEQSRK